MRVISWNMGCAMAPYRASHDDAWRYLIEELRPDLALVQEVILTPPRLPAGRGRLLAHGAWGRTMDWGSGIWAPTMHVEEVEFIDRQGVHACAANVTTENGSLLATSVHVSTDAEQAAHLAAIVDVLAPMLAGHRMIVAGDFNAARKFDEVYGGTVFGSFFERMRVAGFHECHWRLHGREVQTFWGKQTDGAYQDDHFFVNEDLGAKVSACRVIDNEDVRRLSDHAPVELIIDL